MSALTLSQITHRYDEHSVLESVSLRVEPGELVALSGASGCGKTTLLRLIAGFETLQSGTIIIDGNEVASQSQHTPVQSRSVGMVFQSPTLFPHLTIYENIAFGLVQQSIPSNDIHEAVHRMAAQLGIEACLSSYPHMLSGGQQQRVSLARSLVLSPKLLLMDEPFSNLDESLRKRLRTEIFEMLKAKNVTTLLVTHDPSEAMQCAERIVLLENGNVIEDASPHALYHSPNTLTGASFAGPLNLLSYVKSSDGYNTVFGRVKKSVSNTSETHLGVRPEFLHLSRKTDAVSAQITHVDFAGAHNEVHGILENGDAVVFYSTDDTVIKKGDTVSLMIDEDHLI